MEFITKDLPEQNYIYVDRECGYGPEIAEAMGSAFGEVYGFVQENGITPLSMPLTVYLGMDPKVLRFRAGFAVSAEDAARVNGTIKADTLPGGATMTGVHVGPYDRMNETHQAMWAHMEADGIKGGMPIWEVYVDDPDTVEADKLRTEIYCTLG
ncbi:GyrI-like domain-containing protein [Gymnodinialimonas hymeniacidonis]|uniref:GyrI-like domain-containing protein n=1 Tax=Gymnodinialimonas hymeniacidonis TaxID=3126508 RepID=UPI0034C5B8E8